MNQHTRLTSAVALADATSTTPTGTQSTGTLQRRRRFVLAACLATYLTLAAAAATLLGTGSWTAVDVLLLAGWLVATPWPVLGFWNAALGLWLLHGRRDGLRQVAPFAETARGIEPLRLNTAVLLTLRNENPERALNRLRIVARSLDATGFGARFAYFVLSDTSCPEVAAAEEEAVAAWRREASCPDRIVYRRREHNGGFKAGNIHDFCARFGADYDLMLPLDADSLMAGDTIVRLVRLMQANPRLGILQSLAVGAPSASAFARIFQFGMRHGMRAYTMGSAWWTGDCGPFWGHNALVRIAPFAEHCRLSRLPGSPPLGGEILSHDQVEAVLMRRAGFEVRIWPCEDGSWEEMPPTLFEFSNRDLRWCQGNLQYGPLVRWPGLLPVSRFQLVWAILMFVGVPATTLMIALAPLKLLDGEDLAVFPTGLAIALYGVFLLLSVSPKLAGLADVLLTAGGVADYGGRRRFLAGGLIELVFSFLLGAVTTFRITLFMIGLVAGRAVVWNGQERDARAVPWSVAWAGLWPVSLFGVAVCGALAALAPAVLLWSLPLTLGYLTAIPFAVATASPRLGAWLERRRLCAIPEEITSPVEIRAARG